MSNSGPAYDVFLSYNSLDHVVVERVAKELSLRGCSYFIDRWYLQPGQDWVAALERGLSGSRSVAVFVGPHEMGRWQQRERAWALDRQAGDDDYRVIPVLLPGCEPPLGFLAQLMWIDLRDDPADTAQLDALAAAIRGESVDRQGRLEPRATICPYRGLLAFREEDADFFFGREAYTEQLVELVRKQPLVAVIGASGSGKSSVVRAGLVPRLRCDGDGPVWDILTMLPRDDPLRSLAELFLPLVEPELSGIGFIKKRNSLAKDLEQSELSLTDLVGEAVKQQPGTDRLLLVVDQWEELYSLCENADQRQRFIDELLDTTARKQSALSVVLTVRSDFYSQLQQRRELLDRLENGWLHLGPMNRAELYAAIEGPAKEQGVGLTFQSGLIDLIRDDATQEPGRLALLEFALEELWKRRDRGQLTLEAYQDLGRITGAIATRAEEIYSKKLDKAEQAVMPGLFRRLVQAGASTEEDTRRRADLGDLDEIALGVVHKLADERLLVTRGDQPREATNGTHGLAETEVGGWETVEVAHEELLRKWGRLQTWINEDRQFLQWRSRLGPLRDEYERDTSALLRGEALRQSHAYFPSRSDELEAKDRDFVEASHQLEREETFIRERAIQRRKQRNIGFISAAVVFLGLSQWGLWVWARHQRASELVEGLMATPAGGVSFYLDEMTHYQDLTVAGLTRGFDDPERPVAHRLHAAYALMQFDAANDTHLEFVLDSIPNLPADESSNLVRALTRVSNTDENLESELGHRIDAATTNADRGRYLSVAIGLGFTDRATDAARLQSDPTERTALIHEFREFSGDLEAVVRVLEAETTHADVCSALCVAIGRLGPAAAEATGPTLQRLYAESPDGGVHSAAGWALGRQGRTEDDLSELLMDRSESAGWYLVQFMNAQDITMLRIPANVFGMGPVNDKMNPTDSDESKSFTEFWMSDREVTVGQFQEFVDATGNEIHWRGPDSENFPPEFSASADHPAENLNWFDAVEFCNWLSGKHDLQPCYMIERDTAGSMIDVTWIDADGYRLPSEEEWEYACRAMSTKNYCFGDDESLLDEYAIWRTAQIEVCGSRLPNGWGLFDMYGNVWEWCADSWSPKEELRVLRGGSYYNFSPQNLRSANRELLAPGVRGTNDGFRISRTP